MLHVLGKRVSENGCSYDNAQKLLSFITVLYCSVQPLTQTVRKNGPFRFFRLKKRCDLEMSLNI